MANETFKLKGGAELQRMLNSLPAKIEKNIMRSALRAGARVIANEAKANVAVEDGALRRSIRVSARAKKGRVTASVKAGSKEAFYYRFVEFGTAAHTIKPKNKQALYFDGQFAKNVRHPGAKAKPFMRPALDNKADEAIQAVGEQIRKRLNKAGIETPAGLEVDDES